MRVLSKILKSLLAFSLSLMLIGGAGGIIVEKHTCQHCGTDFEIALFSIEESNTGSCCEADRKEKDNTGSCEMEQESCCSFEVLELALSDHLPYSIQADGLIFSISYCNATDLFPSGTDLHLSTVYIAPDKPGGQKTVILNSQYRT